MTDSAKTAIARVEQDLSAVKENTACLPKLCNTVAEHGETIKSHAQSIDLLETGNQIISARMWTIAIGVILALLTGLSSITVALIVALTKK